MAGALGHAGMYTEASKGVASSVGAISTSRSISSMKVSSSGANATSGGSARRVLARELSAPRRRELRLPPGDSADGSCEIASRALTDLWLAPMSLHPSAGNRLSSRSLRTNLSANYCLGCSGAAGKPLRSYSVTRVTAPRSASRWPLRTIRRWD